VLAPGSGGIATPRATIVFNTVTALLAQQRQQLGVMKSMGATVAQRTVQDLAYVGLLSLGAIALSVPGAMVSVGSPVQSLGCSRNQRISSFRPSARRTRGR
jgi:ABC-type antimicrobial peptide transport system permease subunit